MKLSITHKFRSDDRAHRDVSEARQTAPHDGISGRTIAGTRKATAEPSDLGRAVGECSSSERLLTSVLHEMIEQTDLRVLAFSWNAEATLVHLTKRVVEGLRPDGRDQLVWDDATPGLGIRVWPSGRRDLHGHF